VFFADTFAISPADVLTHGRALRAVGRRPRSVSTKTIQPPDEASPLILATSAPWRLFFRCAAFDTKLL
jgi:hypothetical protein